MGIRGEIYSTKVQLQNRTYFFNVKENRMGDIYLNIVESKNRDNGGFDRQSVILFADDMQEFLKGFEDSLRVLEKSVREKRKTSAGDVKQKFARTNDSAQPGFRKSYNSDNRKNRNPGGKSDRTSDRKFDRSSDRKPGKKSAGRSDKKTDFKPPGKKRVVVKK